MSPAYLAIYFAEAKRRGALKIDAGQVKSGTLMLSTSGESQLDVPYLLGHDYRDPENLVGRVGADSLPCALIDIALMCDHIILESGAWQAAFLTEDLFAGKRIPLAPVPDTRKTPIASTILVLSGIDPSHAPETLRWIVQSAAHAADVPVQWQGDTPELAPLERRLAYEVARSDLEIYASETRVDGERWYDVSVVLEANDDALQASKANAVARSVRYLQLRGLLRQHESRMQLVQPLDDDDQRVGLQARTVESTFSSPGN